MDMNKTTISGFLIPLILSFKLSSLVITINKKIKGFTLKKMHWEKTHRTTPSVLTFFNYYFGHFGVSKSLLVHQKVSHCFLLLIFVDS